MRVVVGGRSCPDATRSTGPRVIGGTSLPADWTQVVEARQVSPPSPDLVLASALLLGPEDPSVFRLPLLFLESRQIMLGVEVAVEHRSVVEGYLIGGHIASNWT